MDLFPELASLQPERDRTQRELPTTGILPSQDIRELIRNGKVRCAGDIREDQVQPASLDLRLGKVAYRVQASFLPGKSSPVEKKIEGLKLAAIDLSEGALLERGAVFIVPLMESLALPADIGGKANPKSTTGRLDIFTRLITNGGIEFERVPKGYCGELYVEIVSRTFPLKVREGAKLNQLRFVRGKPPSSDGVLGKLEQRERLVYDDEEIPGEAYIDRGLRISIDLQGSGEPGIIAYKARRNRPPVDLAKVGGHDVEDFWECIPGPELKRIVLDPGDFYLLASRERIRVPLDYAAEMEPFDASIGEFSVHYAGFFDPGFGYGASGEITGTKAVLEVRAHEVPILLEDSQIVGRLIYHQMMKPPDKVYGQTIGSSYQRQGLALSKQFQQFRGAANVALNMTQA